MPEFKTPRRTGFPAGLVLSYLLSSGLLPSVMEFHHISFSLADYTAGQELHLAPKTIYFPVDYL